MLLRKPWRVRQHIRAALQTICLRHIVRLDFYVTRVTGTGRTLNLYAFDDDSIYGLKLMAFVSQSLRLQGWQIRVLRNRSMMLGRAYFRAFGIRSFVYLEDHRLDEEERALCMRKSQEFLDAPGLACNASRPGQL